MAPAGRTSKLTLVFQFHLTAVVLYAPTLHIHDPGAWASGEPSGTISGSLEVE